MEVTVNPPGVAFPELVQFALLLTLTDLVLAIFASIRQQRFSSALCYRGLSQKAAFYVLMGLYYFFYIRFERGTFTLFYQLFFYGVLMAIVLAELSSIKRNFVRLGVRREWLRLIPDDLFSEEGDRNGHRA